MPGRILIADAVSSNRVTLKCALTASYFEVSQASSVAELRADLRKLPPDLILLAENLAPEGAFGLCQSIKADRRLSHIPILMLCEVQNLARALEAGADDVIARPIEEMTLMLRVRNLLRTKMSLDELRFRDETSRALGLNEMMEEGAGFEPRPVTALLVTADCPLAGHAARQFEAVFDGQCKIVSDIDAAIAHARAHPVDVIGVHERVQADGDGLRLIARLRAMAETRHTGIVFLVASARMDIAALALEVGANDFLFAPLDGAELMARLRTQLRRKIASDRLRDNLTDGLKMAVTDPLTGLFNRRYATNYLRKTITRAAALAQPFAVMMLDLDRFKSVNDSFGHDAGDAVLVEMTRRLTQNMRGIDLVSRFGGEEFFIIMPDTTREQACVVSERVRSAVADAGYCLPSGQEISTTVSIGVSMGRAGDSSADAVIKRADEALYVAKHGGRNRVQFHNMIAA